MLFGKSLLFLEMELAFSCTSFAPALQGIWHLITQVNTDQSSDKWTWSSSTTSICSFAATWHAIREVAPAFPLSHLDWQPNAYPKMSIC